MQEQNFENQVRQQMEGLNFTPSDAVWQKVEARIRKKKERRRILFWVLPLLGVLVGIWWFNSSKLQKQSAFYPNNQKHSLSKVKEKKSATAIANQVTKSLITKPEVINKKETPIIQSSAATSLRRNIATNIIRENNIHYTEKTHNSTRSNYEQASSTYKSRYTTAQDINTVNQDEPGILQSTKSAISFQPQNDLVVIASVPDSLQNAPIISSIMILVKNPESEKSKAIKQSWEWGFTTALGSSGFSNGLLHVFSPARVPADYTVSNPTTSSGSPTYFASKVNRGFSFSAGFTAKRHLGKRSLFVSGLQYHFFSTYNRVGQKIADSSVLAGADYSYFGNSTAVNNNAASPSKNYQNQYHFIEVPLGVEYAVTSKKNLVVYTGVTMAQLVSSNALHYDDTRQIYFHDNNLFNKTQWFLNAHITYRLWKYKNNSLSAGPQLQYGITPMQKTTASANSHLFFEGLHLQFSF